MPSSRDRLLQHCTVKLIPTNSSNWGTGFLITPNHILTCAHVVAGYEVIPAWWRGQAWTTATVEQILPSPVDLALLQIAPTEGEQPPSVLLSETFNPFDRLYVYGYPDDFPDGGSVTIQCEGEVQEQGVTLIKAQAGQVRPGHSGSPALNWETGLVCGVVSDTRNRSTDLGGLLIPVSTLFRHVPDIQAQNQAAHPRDSLWWTLPLQSLAVSQPRSAVPPPQFSTYNPATFAGRTAETATLTACLQGGCRVLAITGMTGIGKTALAERVVANLLHPLLPSTPLRQQGMEQQNENLPYYRFSLDDRSLTPDFASSGAALLRALGEEPTLADQQDSANLVEHILQRLHHQPCRLQIDSLERLLRGNEQEGWSEFCDPLWLDLLQKFLAGTDCPSQLLLTSQDIPGDLDAVASRYPQFWHCEPLQGLNPDEQRTLFQNLGLTPTEADWELLQRIGAFYDGHPLVLQVIAEEIRQRPFQGNIHQYWHHYAAEFTTIAPTTATKLDRSRLFRRRVRQRVEQTLQRLPEPARQMLCASAVFRRPVPVEFWYAMLPDSDADAAFDTLQDRHLIEYALTPTPSTPSPFTPHPLPLIRQHNLIRSIAYTLLKADPTTWEAAERQAAHLWLTVHQSDDISTLTIVENHIEAISHYGCIQDGEKVIAILATASIRKDYLYECINSVGRHQDLIKINSFISHEMSSKINKVYSIFLAEAYLLSGDHYTSIELCKRFMALEPESVSANEAIFALSTLGNSFKFIGDPIQSISYHMTALEIAFYEKNDIEFMSCLSQAISSVSEIKNLFIEKFTDFLSELSGKLKIKPCNENDILRDLEEIKDFKKKIKDLDLIILGYFTAYFENDNFSAFKTRVIISSDIGNPEYIDHALKFLEVCDAKGLLLPQIYLNLTLSYLHSEKDLSTALQFAQTALEIAENTGNTVAQVAILEELVELFKASGDTSSAQAHCRQAIALKAGIGIPLKAECEALIRSLGGADVP